MLKVWPGYKDTHKHLVDDATGW